MFSLRKEPTGFTLVELLVVCAVVTIIYLGITVLIKFATKSMWSLKGNLDLTDQASGAMQFISTDFKYAKASSMGNLAENPGFEEPGNFTTTLPGWDGVIGTGYYVDRTLPDNAHNKGGFRTLELRSGPTAYFTNSITIPTTKPYLISSWAKADNTTASLSLVKDDKSDFLPPVQVGSNNNYYVHLTSAVTLNAGQVVRLKVSEPALTWGLSFDTANIETGASWFDLRVFNGRLFTLESKLGSSTRLSYVYDGIAWAKSATNSVGSAFGLCVYNDGASEALYAGGNGGPGGSLSIYNGVNFWNAFPSPPPNPPGAGWYMIFGLGAYAGKLYAGGSDTNGNTASIYAYTPGTGWSVSYADNNVDTFAGGIGGRNLSYVYQNKLYVSGRLNFGWPPRDNLYVYDGSSWNIVGGTPPSIGISCFCEYNGKLYVGMTDDTFWNRIHIYVYDGLGWSFAQTFTGSKIMSMAVYKDQLYMGIGGDWAGSKIYVRGGNDAIWNEVFDAGWPAASHGISELCVYQEKLYAGSAAGGSDKVYVLGGSSFFDDVSISPVAVVFDSSTVVNGVANVYRYQTSKGRAETDIYRFKLYRLEFQPITARNNIAWPGILYRKKSADGGTTWQPDGWRDDGAICENVERLRIFNRQQESFDVELDLRKIIETGSGKEQTYKTRTTIKPNIP